MFRTIGHPHRLADGYPAAAAERACDDPAAGLATAGIATKIGNHSFRARGITAYLKKRWHPGEKQRTWRNHASTRTTQLYDRWPDDISLDEVERIGV